MAGKKRQPRKRGGQQKMPRAELESRIRMLRAMDRGTVQERRWLEARQALSPNFWERASVIVSELPTKVGRSLYLFLRRKGRDIYEEEKLREGKRTLLGHLDAWPEDRQIILWALKSRIPVHLLPRLRREDVVELYLKNQKIDMERGDLVVFALESNFSAVTAFLRTQKKGRALTDFKLLVKNAGVGAAAEYCRDWAARQKKR